MTETEREQTAHRIVVARRKAAFDEEVLQELTNILARENLAVIGNGLSEYSRTQRQEWERENQI